MIEKVKTLIVGYFCYPILNLADTLSSGLLDGMGHSGKALLLIRPRATLKYFGGPTETSLEQPWLDVIWLLRNHVPETKRIRFRGDEGSLSESVFLKELLSGRTFILSGPRFIQFIKFRIVSGTIESLFRRVTTLSQFGTPKSVSVRLSHNCVTNSYLCLR